MSDVHDALEVVEAAGLSKVKPWTYPGTYAFVPATSLMAAQVYNRDSASWKKAEHIILMGHFPDAGEELLPYWREFTGADPDRDRHIQKLYVRIGKRIYVVYDSSGAVIGKGELSTLLK